jgi:hypothetical protein
MPHIFDADVVSAILRHMNGDHTDDNLLITRAFSAAEDGEDGKDGEDGEITDAVMTDLDGDGGVWRITRSGAASELRIAWPSGPIAERPAVRREVVALYDLACAKLGVEPRPHA